MKKIKYVLFTAIILTLNIIFGLNVFGVSKYSMTLNGPGTASRESNITLSLNVVNPQSVSGGFDGYSGEIAYDETKVEFVSATGSIKNWDFGSSKSNGVIKFVGYDNFAPDNVKNSDTEIFKITFKVLSSATDSVTFTAKNLKGSNGDGFTYPADSTSKTVTITTTPVTPSKSNNANLSNLTVGTGTLSPSFNAKTTNYALTVPNNTTSIKVNAVAADSKAKVTITGNTNLSVGKNNVLVEVQAEDGTKKTYKIEVTRSAPSSSGQTGTDKPSTDKPTTDKPSTDKPEAKSSNNKLKAINGISQLDFDPDKTEYNIDLPYEVKDLNVTAEAQDSKSKISYSNANLKDLEVGKTNTITIAVTAEDSSLRIYTINVKRTQYKSDTDLKELIVNNEDIYKDGEDEYKVTVPSDTDTLDISAIPKSEDSVVKIIGADKLKEGSNTVLVEVTDKNGFSKSYKLNVEKEPSNFLFNFLKDWWLLLLAMLFILIILLVLIYLHERNKKLLEELNNREPKYIPAQIEETTNEMPIVNEPQPTHIDNTYNILYNSNNNTVAERDAYVPKHSSDDQMNNTVSDDSISDIQNKLQL